MSISLRAPTKNWRSTQNLTKIRHNLKIILPLRLILIKALLRSILVKKHRPPCSHVPNGTEANHLIQYKNFPVPLNIKCNPDQADCDAEIAIGFNFIRQYRLRLNSPAGKGRRIANTPGFLYESGAKAPRHRNPEAAVGNCI